MVTEFVQSQKGFSPFRDIIYQIPSAMGLLIADLVVVSKGHLYNMAITSFIVSDPSLVLGDFSFGCSNPVCPIYDLIISRLIKSCIKLF